MDGEMQMMRNADITGRPWYIRSFQSVLRVMSSKIRSRWLHGRVSGNILIKVRQMIQCKETFSHNASTFFTLSVILSYIMPSSFRLYLTHPGVKY